MQIREIWLKEDIVELFEAVYEENLETVETKYVRTVFTWALGWGWGGGGVTSTTETSYVLQRTQQTLYRGMCQTEIHN